MELKPQSEHETTQTLIDVRKFWNFVEVFAVCNLISTHTAPGFLIAQHIVGSFQNKGVLEIAGTAEWDKIVSLPHWLLLQPSTAPRCFGD
jgi:hypothetical protein